MKYDILETYYKTFNTCGISIQDISVLKDCVWKVIEGSVNVHWQWCISVNNVCKWCLSVIVQFTHVLYNAAKVNMCSTLVSDHVRCILVARCSYKPFCSLNYRKWHMVFILNCILYKRKLQSSIFFISSDNSFHIFMLLTCSFLVVVQCSVVHLHIKNVNIFLSLT